MSLADQIAADAAIFVNASDFAEEVTYKPRTGTARTIKAIVSREQDQQIPEAPQMREPGIVVDVANDAATGIAADDANMIGGRISVALQAGGTTVDLAIRAPNPIYSDAGITRINLGRPR